MTELLKNVFEDINNEQPVEISKQLVIDWLDNLIEMHSKIMELNKMINNNYARLSMGKLDSDKGEYDIEMKLCYELTDKKLQLFKGIRKVAEILGVVLIEDNTRKDEYKKITFNYNGWEVFELERRNQDETM